MPSAASLAVRIQREGEPLLLRRAGQADVTVSAFVRGYRADELVGTINQGDRELRIAGPDLTDSLAPKKNDQVIIRGRTTTVQSCETRTFRGVDAMHVLQVRG